MTTPIINDNGVNREMTADEAAAYQAWADEQNAKIQAQADADAQRAADRASAVAKLGLTANEITALFG